MVPDHDYETEVSIECRLGTCLVTSSETVTKTVTLKTGEVKEITCQRPSVISQSWPPSLIESAILRLLI